jgi:hypothetical protein
MRWMALLGLIFVASGIQADEKDELLAKQKTAAAGILKKLGVDNPKLVETEQFFLYGPFPEEKLKSWAEVLQRQYDLALKGLKFGPTDNTPKGKISVYFFPERKGYSLFIGDVLNERPEKDNRGQADTRSDAPWVAVTVLPGSKPTDLEYEASNQIAGALLQNKVGRTALLTWMKEGFAKSIQMRSTGATTERAKLRAWLGPKGKYKVGDAWGTNAGEDRKLLAASLMEYFIFGPGGASYSKIVSGLASPDGVQRPTFDAALTSAEIKPDELDRAWKKWVLTGK